MDCCVEEKEIAEMRASEYHDRGLCVFSNVWKNCDQLPTSALGLSLQGSFQGKVAIVCGAGKSLEGALPCLKELEDRALLITGGSALASLHRNGIVPHFMLGVDPSPSWERFLEPSSFLSPFVYQSRFSSSQLSLLLGKKVWYPGSGMCALDARLLEARASDTGWSVANFGVAFATFLGCSRIVLAGMDFCAPKEQMYASNLLASPQEELRISLPGTSLYTRRDWILSRDWLLTWIKNHPQIQWERFDTLDSHLQQGVPFASCQELFSLAPYDFAALVHASLQEIPSPSVNLEKVRIFKEEFTKSLQAVLSFCNQMLSIWGKVHPQLPFQEAEYVICKSQLQMELAYEEILFPLWQVWKEPVLRQEIHEAGRELHELLFFKTTMEMYLTEIG